DIYAQIGNRAGELHAMTVMANVLFYTDRVHEAVDLLEETLGIAQELELQTRQGTVLNNLSVLYTRLGRYDEAISVSEQSVSIHHKYDQHLHKVRALDTLGNVWLAKRDYEQARRVFLESIAIIERVGENEHYPILPKGLGLAEQALGNT